MEKCFSRDCAHFRQHYILTGEKLMKVYCGHCTHIRSKKRKPDAAVCDKFLFTDSSMSSFVTKSYLTKELLQFVLDMELLPKISDYGAEE